ncbi:recQ-mediated genome instability protein 1 [Aristolochia californica]|uniref:recQ-mediated genome instability protein 1 n=1 Tax=Aristolochia californica TaxID=171875 RepID=UPI0035DFE362
MPRPTRRFLIASDDEDDENNPPASVPPVETFVPDPPSPNAIPFQISDDEFVDVPDVLSPPSPSFQPGASLTCPIADFLLRLGVRPRREWLDACISFLSNSRPGFANLDVSGKAKLCFAHFLCSDMNFSGGGVLPVGVHTMHCVELTGPFVLQVDEIVNISSPLRDRYRSVHAGIKRCLKLSITDGCQRVFAMEYRPMKDLDIFSPAGLKICIRNVQIRRGLLMLVPEIMDVLGGSVEDLDAARRRLVEEVNKPPRAKRTRTGELPPLATRARLAAWPNNLASNSADRNASSAHVSSHPVGQVVSAIASGSGTGLRTEEGPSFPSNELDFEEILVSSGVDAGAGSGEGCPVPSCGNDVVNNLSSNSVLEHGAVVTSIGGRTVEAAPSFRPDAETSASLHAVPSVTMATSVSRRDTSFSAHDTDHHPILSEKEHCLILGRGKHIPLTYLACMRAKFTMENTLESVHGRIKCFLTGVKGFQFKQRNTFELHVYVDDGSLISEVLVDHNVVQKGIGHSPKEVTAALSSQDKQSASTMREKMKQYQLFLANFEGMMLVEIKSLSSIPIVLEMTQGCSSLDAWTLLKRLKSLCLPQTPEQNHLNPIEISP